MKKIFFIIIIIINIFSFSITIGLYKAPPVVIDENNGFLNDILEFIADNNSIELNIIIDSQQNLIEKLKSGKIDGVAPLAFTPERSQFFHFNQEAVFFEWAVIYTRKNLNLSSILDLKNKKIGVMKTDIFYEGKDGIKDLLKGFNIKAKFVEFDTYEDIFKMLDRKKIDAGVVPRFFGLDQEKKYNVKKTSIIFKPIGGYIMYKDSNLKNIFDLIDKQLKKLKEDNNSFYYRIFDKYFEPIIREKIPDWLKYMILFGLTIAILIIAIFYMHSKILKKRVENRTTALKKTLLELENKVIELNSSKKLIEEIVNLSPNPIYIKNIEQEIVFVNNAFANLLGLKKENIIGKSLLDLFNSTNKSLLEESIIEDIDILSSKRKGFIDIFMLNINNKKLYFKDYKTAITLPNKENGLLVLWVDITENINHQKNLEITNAELQLLNQKLFKIIDLIQYLGNKEIDLRSYFNYLLKFAIELSETADYGSISISDGEHWKFISAVGYDIEKLRNLPLKSKYMIKTGEKLKVMKGKDLEQYNKKVFDNKKIRQEFLKTAKPINEIMIATINISKDKTLSFSLETTKNSKKTFNDTDKMIFQAFINIAKTALSSKLNIDQVKNAYLNFASKLALIAEAHDDITGQHIYRVGELASFIAKKLNLPAERILEMREFAPLHDIGKIFIPLEILNKKSRLTDEEYEIMKKHTIYAERLLGDDPYFDTALKIAIYHHEKYNGGGYPFNLKSEKIPIEAQIVSIVDVYDALRSKRPYKEALSHESAMNIILEGDDRTSPEDFNPEILNIFRKYSNEIKEIYNSFSD
ncbi:HD domain-containing phosphohydrolase [Marinitoga sp. 1154]|uniref:HD domain-containing phosphohydrolase n=1 Tax=Marinitoga sp. 1154 TaxID=1643335 RepID=UPI001586C4DC|nr:HD domain-containing phosphohydrolase [Marinitoga sp. 1154]